MSRAEEKALEVYPICKHSNYGYKDLNEDKRKCYIEGYKQAEKDFMEKAEALWTAFKQFMKE